jgi:transposase InsO family protein
MPMTTRWPKASSTRSKTELITDRVWRTRSQLELAIVEYIGWFNNARLQQALGDRPPAEFEALYAPTTQAITHRDQLEETK